MFCPYTFPTVVNLTILYFLPYFNYNIFQVKYIDRTQLGRHEVDCWYFSPYPEDYGKAPKLYICSFCLRYMKMKKTYLHHIDHCVKRQPPGLEIYRKGEMSIYEINGTDDKLYC